MTKISYRSLLSSKDTARILLAINISRLSGGIVPFGLVAFYASRDDFSAAGIASAIFMVVGAFTAPYKGRLITRFSPRRIMAPMSFMYGVLVSLAIWVEVQVHYTSLAILLIGLGSMIAPPVGAVTRSIWARLGRSQDEIRALHSLDSVLEEATFAIAPLITSFIWVTVGAVWIVPVGGLTAVVGTVFVLIVGLRSKARDVFSTPIPADGVVGTTRWSRVVTSFALYRQRTTVGLVGPMLGLGIAMGALSIGLPALAMDQVGNQAFSGVVLGMISATGAVIGLIYGKLSFRRLSNAHQYQIASLVVLVSMAAIALSGSVIVTVAGAITLGAGMTPMFISSYVLIGEVAHIRDHTELNASIGSGFNLGDGLATVTTGFLLGTMQQNAALGVTTIAVALFMASSLLLSARRSPILAVENA